jgi:hypothetical protein
MREKMTTAKRIVNFLAMIFRSRIFLMLLVLAMIAFTIWVSGPIPDKNATLIATSTPHPAILTAGTTQTTPVIEIMEKTPTTGVILGGIIVIVVLFVGTFIVSRNYKNN